MFTDAELETELTTDPIAVGYIGKDDATTTSLINAPNMSIAINRGRIDKTDFMAEILPIIDEIRAMAVGAVQTKWQYRISTMIAPASYVDASSQVTQSMLNELVTDGLATAAQVTGLLNRLGSRAEQLWGSGTFVLWTDVARVRNAKGR